MEHAKNDGNAGTQTSEEETTRKKHRKSKNKVSNLHVRLSPNFDIWDSLRPEKDVPCTETHFQIHNNQEEIDPKTLDFSTLVTFLHPTFIFEYLRKIQNFLHYTLCELSFPNIASYKEEFLIRIAQDNQNLRCSVFSTESQKVSKEILAILHRKRHQFKWVHVYGGGRYASNVLLYKKLYFDKSLNLQEKNNLRKCLPTQPQALASTLEDLNLDRQDIPAGFKIQMLNTTLKFIKDNTRLILTYPEMPYNQAAYIFFLLQSCYNEDTSVGFGFKSLYSPLYEAMITARHCYDFNVEFFESNNFTAQVVVQKTAKSIVLNCNRSLESTTLDPLRTKSQKDFLSKQRIIEFLSESFIRSSLTEVLEFLQDEERASLEFKNITSKDTSFLQSIPSLARSEEYYQLFDEESIDLLKQIARIRQNMTQYKLVMEIGKINKKTFLRDMMIHKTPSGEIPQKSASKKSKNCAQKTSNTTNKRDCSKNNKKLNNFQTASCNSDLVKVENVRNIEITVTSKEVARKVSVTTSVGSTQSMCKEIRPPIKNGIAFHSAGTQVLEPMQTEPDDETSRFTWSTRKNKLIEAMSTPLESNRAERMMRLMGWDGGALGARGEGITEPIIPALHISPGAGLGHVKSKATSRSAAEFRIIFLQRLQTWIATGAKETAIQLGPMSKREARFINPTLRSLNDRKNIGLHRTEEVALVMSILEALKEDPELFIEYKLSEDRSEIILKRRTCQNQKSSKKKKKKSKIKDGNANQSQKDNCAMDEESEITEQLYVINKSLYLEKRCPSSKSAKSLAYRLLFLQKIRDFCKSEESSQEIQLNTIINAKQRGYIQSVVMNINKREVRNVYNTFLENDLMKEIRVHADLCYINVVFIGQKIILEKKYYQKRFTNSALGLPTPRNDKNTIIYINNVPIQDVNVKIGSDDSDIMIDNDNINMDNDIIVISEDNDSFTENTRTVMETDCDSKDISIDLSNESMLLDVLENNIEQNSDLDSCITELETVLYTDRNDNTFKKEVNNNHNKNDLHLILSNNINDFDINLKSLHQRNDLNLTISKDINNDSDMNTELSHEKNYLTSKKDIEDNIDINFKISDINKHIDVINPYSDVNNDFDNLSPCSSKRSRSDSENSDIINKKYKGRIIKQISIVPENSQDIMTIDLAKKVQILISKEIDKASFLPLLQCHGNKDNNITYSCHSEKSYLWLKKVISAASDLKIKVVDVEFKGEDCHKLKLKVNTFIEEGFNTILDRLELYNAGLVTDKWKLINRQIFRDFIVITLWVDNDSFEYICDSNFSLFAGVDKVQFCICFEAS